MALVLAVLLFGCVLSSPSPDAALSLTGTLNATEIHAALDRLMAESPCGGISFSGPAFNVTGITAGGTPAGGSPVYLYITKNTSVEAAHYALKHCPVLTRTTLTTDRRFHFDSVPPGTYAVVAPGRTLAALEGVPADAETRSSGYAFFDHWVTQTDTYALAAFSIRAGNGSGAE